MAHPWFGRAEPSARAARGQGWRLPPLILLLFLLVVGIAASAQTGRGSPLGRWYLTANNERLTLTITRGPQPGSYAGTLAQQEGAGDRLDELRWDAATGRLEFRRNGAGFWEWYLGRAVEGVLVGRFSRSTSTQARPARASEYRFHVTGWNSDDLGAARVPRVYEILLDNESRARLRLDASAGGKSSFVGRLKVYSTIRGKAQAEEFEHDLEVLQWNGTNLTFVRKTAHGSDVFTGVASGRKISGTCTRSSNPATCSWSGERAEVLSYGVGAGRGPAGRKAWQARTRKQLAHLLMAGNPTLLNRRVTVLRADFPPTPSAAPPAGRDDNQAAWPQNYRLTELEFEYTLPNPYAEPPITRRSHAFLAVPASLSRAGKLPAVLALNGHGGSAWKLFQPDDAHYWYGDAFARRGYVVLAVDVSHRPLAERRAPYMSGPRYGDVLEGDDSAHGNGVHPSVHAEGFDSDWEENGERVWDALRALDYLISLPYVDGNRIVVTGLSMGGEIATLVAALDTRIALSLPAGYSPDLGVMLNKGNHACWQWLHGDIREYVDVSDLFALTAPRPLIIETGKQDFTYSLLAPPFASDNQVARRARVAYGGDSGNLVHYLHSSGHHFRTGDGHPTKEIETGVRVPEVIAPEKAFSWEWQTDGRTREQWRNLFECLEFFLKRK